MKFHLPKKLLVAVLAAVAATQVYAQTEQVTFDNSKEGVANVTVNGGDLSGYYMYGTYLTKPCAVGTIGAASGWDDDGNAPMEKFSSATVTMNGGTGLQYLSGYGVGGNAFEGDVTVNMIGGDTECIVGGTYYASSVNRDRDVLGTNPGYNHESFGYKANYGQESDPDSQRQNININVTGGEVGQIRGGHSGHSNSGIYKTYLPAVIKAGQDALDAFWNSNPAAVSGDVNIAVTGGTIGGLEGETAAIQGAGGTGFSVDGTVRVTVDGEAEVTGDIIAGSSNVYTFTGATEVAIKGGSVAGNVYAGGDGSGSPKIADGPAPTVKGATKVELSGGTVDGSVYGAGMNDVVNEGTAITISNDGTEVTGTIYGGGIDSEVSGDRTLTVDSSYTGDKEYKVADFTDIAVNADVTLSQMNAASEGTNVAIAEGAELTLTKGEAASSATSITGSGTMKLDGAELAMTDAAGSVTTGIEMTEGAILDLNNAAATGDIQATAATIKNAGNVTGTVTASESLALEGAANLNTLDMTSGATLTGGDMSINTLNLGGNNTITSTGAVTIENGSIQLNDKNSISAGSLALGAGTTLTLEVSDSTTAPITLTSGTLSMAEGSYVEVIFTDSYLDGVNASGQKETALNILIASGAGADSSMQSSISYSGIDTLLWNVSDLQWTTVEGDMYVTGSLTRVTEIVIPEEGGDVPQDIVDTPSGDSVSLDITGKETTLSGDNSHSGGTNVDDSKVTLGSDTALGTGTLTTSGTTTLTTADGVSAVLPGTIQNSGELEISGTYDGNNIDPAGNEADTRVNVSGEEGKNGFFRDGSTVITVVENGESGSLNVADGTTISKDGEELHLAASGKAGVLDYSTYHIAEDGHTASMSDIQSMSSDQTQTVDMSNGTLIVDADAENVLSTGGTIETEGDVKVSGQIAGDTTVKIGNGTTTLSGNNSYTGDTEIAGQNTTLVVDSASALGNSEVKLDDGATLDLNNQNVSNNIVVSGCTITGASNYNGNLTAVDGCSLKLVGPTTANTLTLAGSGAITDADDTLTVSTIEMTSGATGSIAADVITRNGGSIILNDGAVLNITGSLTMGEGTSIVLNGATTKDVPFLTATDGIDAPATGTAVLTNGYGTYVLQGNSLVLTAMFNQNIANALTVSNWGIATTSRAVVNAVRGQRTNTGCIANGRGTAWAAVLGGNTDLNGSDIDLEGAAVGADMKVGENSSVGIALGYTEAEVQPTDLRQIDQTGSYVALYGEHGLKKLSSTSCLSLDWVAAYGITESEGAGVEWEQDSLQLNTRLNWNKKMTDRLCMSVFGGLEYFASNSDTVDGVKTGSIQNLRGEIGVGASYVVWGAAPAVSDGKMGLAQPCCKKLVLHGEIRYMNDMVRSNPVIEMEGLRGNGENPGRQGMGIEAGATYRISDCWSASANYSVNTMEDSREHRVNVGASYTF